MQPANARQRAGSPTFQPTWAAGRHCDGATLRQAGPCLHKCSQRVLRPWRKAVHKVGAVALCDRGPAAGQQLQPLGSGQGCRHACGRRAAAVVGRRRWDDPVSERLQLPASLGLHPGSLRAFRAARCSTWRLARLGWQLVSSYSACGGLPRSQADATRSPLAIGIQHWLQGLPPTRRQQRRHAARSGLVPSASIPLGPLLARLLSHSSL